MELVSESYITDGSLDMYQNHEIFDTKHHESMIKDLENHQEAARQLQLFSGVVQREMEAGRPLSEGAAKMVSWAVESIHVRLGNKASMTIVPALENFVDPQTRHTATKITLEGLVDTLKKVVKKILEMIARIWDKIKQYFSTLISGKESVRLSLEKTAKMVQEIPKDARATGSKLQFSSVSSEDNTPKDVVSFLMAQVPFSIDQRCNGDTTRKIMEDTSILVMANREIVIDIVNCLKNIENSPADYVGLQNDIEKLVVTVKSKLDKLKMKYKRINGNKTHYAYGNLIKNQYCDVEEVLGLQERDDTPRIFNLDIKIVSQEVPGPYEPSILKKDEMSSLVDKAVKLLEQSVHLDKTIPIINKVLERNLSYLDKMAQEENQHNTRDLELATYAVKDLFRYISGILPKLSSDTVSVCTGVRKYVVLSAQHYKQA